MVNLGREIVFRGDLLSRKGENPRITGSRNTRREGTQQSTVGKRIKSVKKACDLRVHRHVRCGAAVGGSTYLPVPSSLRGHSIHLRDPLRLSEPLVRSEKECLRFPNRTADGAPELIAAKRRLGSVEEISRIECAVAYVFKYVSVETVCAGTRGSRYNPAR